MQKTPRKPRKTLEQKTAQQLKPEADKWFSRYIRLRDSSYVEGLWLGLCITCPRRLTVVDRDGRWIASSQNGHFITRGHTPLRYDDSNCNLQCAHCNAWRDKQSMLTAYRKALNLKYGKGTAARLVKEGKITGNITKPELLQIIHDAKVYVEHCFANPENYT